MKHKKNLHNCVINTEINRLIILEQQCNIIESVENVESVYYN